MSSSIVVVGDDDAEELRRITERIEGETDVEKLTKELVECVAGTVRALIRLGILIRRLESLGVDVFKLRGPRMGYFRRIAHGQLLPEVFIDLAGAPYLLKKVAALPIADQRLISHATPLKVLIPGGDHLLIAPKDMTFSQVRQVFAHGSIRTKPQQAAWLAEQQQLAAGKRPLPAVVVDRKRHGICVGELFISASDLASYLAQLTTK